MNPATGHIFLIGYMASGKTTLGRALAAETGRPFVDLDDYISERQGQSVSEIFASRGEDAFRSMEREAISSIIACQHTPMIVACGGGTPCFGDNMERMSAAGTTVWLDAPSEVLLRRLRLERTGRPLVARLDGGGELEAYVCGHLESRRPWYRRATYRFDSSRLETEDEIADSVSRFIALVTVPDKKT